MAFIYDLTDTWNNAGTSFNGIKLNVTDTASAAGSKLVDVQIGGVSKFTVGKTGTVTATGIIQSTTGGFRFPDGTTQTTASVGGAGTVTSVTGTGTVSGLTLTGSITTSGSLTLGGTLSLTSGNVTTALGFTPYNATNPAGYITASSLSPYLTSATAATTYQPLDGDLTAIAALAGTVGLIRKTASDTYSLDTATYLTGITSGQVTTALGYTPYNATNPAGYTANTGTVTSVGLIAGTGVSVSGGPITSSGSITVTNTAPDQVVSLTAGTNVTVTGTYPNFTIAATGGGGSGTVTSVAASGGTTGLTFTGSPVTTSGTLTLGGTLDLDNGGTGATDAPTARTNLGLGTAATTNASAYATAAQGAKADTAVQTIASADGSVTITGTTAIDLSVPVTAATNSVLLPVRNTTGATLTKGTAVYISGATGQISTVSKALATSDATSAQTLGLITANLANNTNGNVTLIGTLTNIDTSAYTDGAQLYLSPTTAGTLTATKPYAPQHLVYIATVEHAHPSQGKLFVKVQNGYEMDELHNVSAQSPANNDGLFYNTSTSLWEKKSIVTALGYTPYNATNPSGYTTNTGTVTSVGGTGTVSGLTLTGSVTTSGNLTLGGTLSLTSGNVTTALGYTPYDAANPTGYITSSALSPYLTSATAATTYQPLDGDLTAIAAISGTAGIVRKTAADTYTLDTNTYLTGITSGQVTTALGFTPYNAANPSGYISSSALTPYLTSATAATTYQPLDGDLTAIAALSGTAGIVRKTAADTYTLDTATYLTGITSGQVTTALGYTPYNATNPSNYLSTVSLTSNVTGTLPVANGGTGATTAGAARTSLSAAALGANTDITSIALTSGTITSVPTGGTDIVNKLYADSIASGINFHQSVRLATIAALPTNTYSNGSSGVGATLTANANGALTVDSVAAVVGNRVLVKNEATSANNGIYTVTQVGDGSTPYILTRATDFDSSGSGVDQIDAGDFFIVTAGTTQSNTSWVQQTPLPITVGTTGLVFTQFAAPVIYSAGTGLTLAGTVFNITNTGLTANTYGSASSVPVVAFNAQGQATGVTNTSIAISGSQITSRTVAVANGGTGASDASTAPTNLEEYPAANPSGYTTNVGTVTSVGGTGTVNGITLTGTVTASGSLTLGGTLSGVNLTSQVTGTLPVANGGTGAATLAANNILLGNGTSAVQTVAPGSNGNFLRSDGTTWASVAAGSIGSSGFTMSTDKLLGRITASTGAIEEIPHATLAEMQAGVQAALRGMSPANIAQAITALATANAILPSQAGNANKVLQTDGTSVSWQLASSSSSDLTSVFF